MSHIKHYSQAGIFSRKRGGILPILEMVLYIEKVPGKKSFTYQTLKATTHKQEFSRKGALCPCLKWFCLSESSLNDDLALS